MDLGEGNAKLRTSQHEQVGMVLTVHHVHHDDLVKHIAKGEPNETQSLKG